MNFLFMHNQYFQVRKITFSHVILGRQNPYGDCLTLQLDAMNLKFFRLPRALMTSARL